MSGVHGVRRFVAPAFVTPAFVAPAFVAPAFIVRTFVARTFVARAFVARALGVLCLVALFHGAALLPRARAGGADEPQPISVGVSARITDLVLPGSQLEVLPLDAHSPLVLRIVATHPHGTAFRYDLEYWALEPGEYDLTSLLRRADGTTAADLPSVPVSVRSVLPPGIVRPHAPVELTPPPLGGYVTLSWIGAVVWIAGLAALLLFGRKKRLAQAEAGRVRPRTLAERLRPLVERAMRGELTSRERAQLELGLVAHWRRRLRLDEERPDVALAHLREHAEAGPLLQSLEDWLHRPDPPQDVDVAALLAPYRDMPAHELDARIEDRVMASGTSAGSGA